ncbi:MAG: hypothetical protein IJZ89_06755 [Clostridia bacterium]|nr:hypothetical protein [Clostridia bacterium]
MKKYLVLVLAFVLIAALFVSCGETKNDDSNTVTLRSIDNLAEYAVVRGENSSDEVTALTTSLRKAINEATGASVAVKTDYYNNKYEILIGETKRQQSIDASKGLRCDDYTIKIDGNKIVVAAGSEKALGEAIELFKAQFIDAEKKTIKVPSGKGYSYKGTYTFDKLTVDGVDLSEFNIYYEGEILLDENGDLPYVETLRTTFGVDLYLERDLMIDDSHYIIIDNKGLTVDEYSIEIADGNIYIKGSYNTIDDAMAYFVGDFLEGKKTVELKSGEGSEIMSIGKKDMYTKEQLMQVLTDVYNDDNACIIGQQTEGNKSMVSETIADFVDSTGQKPGIIGIDLAIYGLKLPTLSEEKWSQTVCEITDYCADGGIITASAHWDNPSDPSQYVRGNLDATNTSKEEYEEDFRATITEGTEYNQLFKKELDIDARFLKALQDNGVIMVWRPLHEMNGNWFWYCVTQQGITVDAQCLIDMWQYVYDYYVNDWGLDSLVWCYGPNTSGNVVNTPGGTMSPMYCYPGDEYVDMVGVDWYSGGNLEIRENDNYLLMVDETKKIGALTEFGPGGVARADEPQNQPEYYSTEDLIIDLWTLKDEGYKFTYLLTWTAGAYSIGVMGGETGGYEFMNEDYTLGQAEVKAMFDALK